MILVILSPFYVTWLDNKEVYVPKTEVESVYWHEGNRYTVCVKDGAKLVFRTLPKFHGMNVSIFCDVKENDPCWYTYRYNWNGLYGATDSTMRIHIHSTDDLKPSSWNHGKFGTGSTTRLK